ncbi:TFIIB family protein [Abortiporus biennis]
MTVCTDCGGTVIEYDAAAGNGFCVNCGTVVEENTIVNEVTFGETSTGAAMVQGAFVAQGATRARMGGPFGNRGGGESREQTIANASRKIAQVSGALRLSEVVQLAATRMYTLAVEHKFTKGRKSMNVVAVCLYVACRQKETRNYMLIDFSDLLQVNVFELGHTYLQLVQTLNLRLPLIDPSHYISRFASLLEFGDETSQVALDATRLVQRFDRDWMTRGRRPSGICGAALLIAARMNNFRRSVEEVVQVVKIADTTLRKRVEEFRTSKSAGLSVSDFRSVWLEEEMDPPSFSKGREKERLAAEAEAAEKLAIESGEIPEADGKKGKGKTPKGKGKKRKRKRGEDGSDEEHVHEEDSTRHIDASLLNEGILAGTVDSQTQQMPHSSHPQPLFLPDDDADLETTLISQEIDINMHIDPSLIDPSLLPSTSQVPGNKSSERATSSDALEEELHTLLTSEVSSYLESSQSKTLVEALDYAEKDKRQKWEEKERERKEAFIRSKEKGKERAVEESAEFHPAEANGEIADGTIYREHPPPIDTVIDENVNEKEDLNGDVEPEQEDWWLEGLDEEELDAFLLTDEEVKIKERVWVELNKDYLEAIVAKQELEAIQEASGEKKSRKKRKAKQKDQIPQEASTAFESVQNLIKKTHKFSRRINYDALNNLFTDAESGSAVPLIKMSQTPAPDFEGDEDEDEDAQMFSMPAVDDKADESEMVVVEESGGGVGTRKGADDSYAFEEADEGGGDNFAEWDGYEQEV